jgi:CRP/FNR family transcriptional regulator, cyclic AMP receptor protein
VRTPTASLPLPDHDVPARIESLAATAPHWTGRGRVPAARVDTSAVLLLVEWGVALVSSVATSGRVVAAALLAPGDVWSGTAAAPARVDALGPSSIALIDARAVAAAAAADASCARWLADRYLRRAVAAERRAADIVTVPVEERVRRVLRELARAASTPIAGGRVRVDARVSQERLAWLAGTTRESANRAVRSLIDAGALSRAGGRYVLSPGADGPS